LIVVTDEIMCDDDSMPINWVQKLFVCSQVGMRVIIDHESVATIS
jgi:hypothetical protein